MATTLINDSVVTASYEISPLGFRLEDVRARMGEPAMQWDNADGSKQLAYPRGPSGTHTFMVSIDAAGRFERIENVLDTRHFARVRLGAGMPEILRLLGPAVPQWSNYFAARDEQVWEWLYCDDQGYLAHFDVLFDGTSKTARTSYSWPEMRGQDGGVPVCGH